jgi:hypothetical protein
MQNDMTESKSAAVSAAPKHDALWARIDDGLWYAIPPNMAEEFRKAGAEVVPQHQLPAQSNKSAAKGA